MADGGGGATGNSRSSPPLDGAFLLQLLRKPPQTQHQHQHQPSSSSSSFPPHQTLNNDPAVAAVGPTNSSFLIRPHSPQETLLHRHHFSPPLSQPPPAFNRRAPPPGFPHHPSPPPPPPPSSSHFSGSPQVFRGDHPLGAPAIHRPHPPPLANSHFSACPPAAFSARDFAGNSSSTSRKGGLGSRAAQSNVDGNSAESTYYWQKSQHSMQPPHHHIVSSGNFRNVVAQRQDVVERQDGKQQNVGRGELNHRQGNGQSLLHRELMGKHGVGGGNGKGFINGERFFNEGDGLGSKRGDIEDRDDLVEEFEELMVTGESSVEKRSNSSRAKDVRLDLYRGHYVSSQRVRIRKREMECRYDVDSFTPSFLSIYKSLIPADEEKRKQIQLLLSLAKLVNKEWPHAQLHLYGSCANSFGVSNSDIDICLAIDDSNMSKSDILLKLADILESDNLQNVQALTHARVPIVKMMDPVTGISCDICINNLLAVANTKLLRDYAQIDDRLRQLAFIVKHWAKSRGVNETYRGTLSSYAYVLMCIHYLQMRKPAILPCLQSMQPTYAVTLDGTRCAYFDQVDRLRNFGAQNNESISRLLWGFFHYWAYFHDYMNDVISVRTGQIISKRKKDWTRRIGNDRHLICIEDPFEVSHDLGRVVDKFSIKILREEFERAADILQYDRNPSVTLFEPYVPRSMQNELLSD